MNPLGDHVLLTLVESSQDNMFVTFLAYFIDLQVYRDKKAQMRRSMELYSLIDQRLFPEIYEKVFKSSSGDIAKNDDLGGILLSHYNKKRLEIYTMSATEEGEPITVGNQQFNSKRQASDAVRQFYNNFRGIFGDYLVVIITGPNLTDLDNMTHTQLDLDPESDGETPIPDDEDDNGEGEGFGMYESAMVSWLSPRTSAVGHYTRRPSNQNNYVNTFNVNVPPPHTDTPFTNARSQTPTHFAPKINPDFARLIRRK